MSCFFFVFFIDEIDRLRRQEDILTPDAIRDYLIQIKERDYNSYENRVYLINVFLYKIIVYKDGRIVAMLNTTGDEGPTKLESMVRALVGQDHHIYTIKRVRMSRSFFNFFNNVRHTRSHVKSNDY